MSEPDWRTGHCAEFAAKALDRNIWDALGGCPRSWREAAALYRRLGARTLAEAVSAVLGPSIAPVRASRGDIVMIDGALGICRGDWAEFMDRMQPMAKATRAWRARLG